MKQILKRVQLNLPFQQLHQQYLPLVVKEKVNPEIGFNSDVLDGFRRDQYLEVAQVLRDAGVSITFHAPFMDLRPGAVDPRIRQVSMDRLNQVFDLVPYFKPMAVVCHPSFDERYYVASAPRWLENSIATWGHFARLAGDMGTLVMLENVYEADPYRIEDLLDGLNSPHLRFCFDTGHFNAFSRTELGVWLERVGSRIGELHLHDNNGKSDDHLPVGQGSFPFRPLFDFLRAKGLRPIITVEPHNEKNLWETLKNIMDEGLLKDFL